MTMAPGVLDPMLSTPVAGEDRTSTRCLYLPAFVLAGGTAWLLWIGAGTLERSGNLAAALVGGWAELVAPMVVALVALLLLSERRWPAEQRTVRARGHVHDAVFFVLHVVAVVPLMTLLGVAFAQLLGSHAGWLEAPWTGPWPRWLLLGVTILLMDGANWLAHWADHRFAALWRMHALHHSQEEVNVLTAFRAHPLSHLAGFFLATVPVIVLMGDRGMAPLLITGYVCLGTLPHANVPWSFGPLGKVVVSPAYHRLHHSAEQSDGYNLGVVLTVWDVLAGRARFPVRDAPTFRTGLADRPVPVEQSEQIRPHLALLLAQLAEPFRVVPSRESRDAELVGASPGRSEREER
jgi:sterol desaturase/sphingolipid hydroxylase (fatty acid hydroxylase superfamily)